MYMENKNEKNTTPSEQSKIEQVNFRNRQNQYPLTNKYMTANFLGMVQALQ